MNTEQIIHVIDKRFSKMDDQFESIKQKINELNSFLPTTSEETKQEPPCICEELTRLDDNIMKLNKNVQTVRGIVADLVVGLCHDEELVDYFLINRLGYDKETVEGIRSILEKKKILCFQHQTRRRK